MVRDARWWWTTLVGIAIACDSPSSSPPDLEDRVFVSQSVTENGAPRPLYQVESLWLRFWEPPRVGASAGCNSMDGQWAIEDGLFVVANGAITEKGCDGPAHAQDDWYFGFLQSQPAITADGDDLVLEGDGIRIEYLDQEIATPDRPLAGPTWSVEGIGDGVGVLFAEWPQPGTLVLADDGTVQVSTSCNGGQGSYVVVDDTVEFSDVSVTEAGCPDEFSQRMEEGMLALLYGAQPVTWEITVDRLSLRGDEASLELVAP